MSALATLAFFIDLWAGLIVPLSAVAVGIVLFEMVDQRFGFFALELGFAVIFAPSFIVGIVARHDETTNGKVGVRRLVSARSREPIAQLP